MLISYRVEGDVLQVTLHRNLDITSRAAAAQEIEALVHACRPRRVTVKVPAGQPAPATLSAILRAHRTCKNLGIPLDLAGASTAVQRLFRTNIA
ncbi:hypothetical protein [Streptomyces sp. NPDC048419]|uniref:hypothetical protein n=1 Tax=Streptomyces sp. NPDC048419 TaxID=3365547 RepID=UPI00371B19A8